MIIEREIETLCNKGVVCIDCDNALFKNRKSLQCFNCNRSYNSNGSGVWLFQESNQKSKTPHFYINHDFLKWQEVFSKTEVNNWSIYRTSLRRYFSQAGHRALSSVFAKEKEEIGTILEIGAGTGALLEHVTDISHIAVDHSLASLARLKKIFQIRLQFVLRG